MQGEVFVTVYHALGPVGYGIFCLALVAVMITLIVYAEKKRS